MDFYQDPFPAYREWRETEPAKIPFHDGSTPWVISRYDDVVAALNHPGLSSVIAPTGFLNHLDPPEHTRLRKLLVKAFSARRVDALRPRIQRIADDLLDEWMGASSVDLIDTFAFPLPITVIGELLGVPAEDHKYLRDLTAALMEMSLDALYGFDSYVRDLVKAKKIKPSDDLISELVDVPEVAGLVTLLITAGHETTVQLIGNGMLTLLRNPEFRADPADMVDELLRYDGPFSLGMLRIATMDVHIGGATIPAGELVMISLGAANRDPQRFPDPDALKLGRDSHVAFGHGIHHCVGARLARLEGEIAFGTILRRFPNLRLVEEPEWRRGIIRGLTALVVSP